MVIRMPGVREMEESKEVFVKRTEAMQLIPRSGAEVCPQAHWQSWVSEAGDAVR